MTQCRWNKFLSLLRTAKFLENIFETIFDTVFFMESANLVEKNQIVCKNVYNMASTLQKSSDSNVIEQARVIFQWNSTDIFTNATRLFAY